MIRSSSSTFWNVTLPCTASFDDHGAFGRVLEAHDRRDARNRLLAVAAAAVVARLFLARELVVAHLLEFFLRAVTVIRLALGEPLLDDFAISRVALALVERTFVGVEPQPFHAVEDHLHGFGRRSLAVGVLDAQDECAAVSARIEPAEERGPHAADVQQTRSDWERIAFVRSWGRDSIALTLGDSDP